MPELRRRNCPVPAIIAHGPLGGPGYGWVQDRLAGDRAAVLDDALLGDLADLIGRLADAPAGRHRNNMASWVPAAVFGDAAGWWRTAAASSPEAARFSLGPCAHLAAANLGVRADSCSEAASDELSR